MLKHLMVEIFDGCNCKCNMCTIWKNKGKNIDLYKLNKFLSSQYCNQLESIGITGGEPMLSNQLVEIADLLNSQKNIKTIYISSNGCYKNKLIDFIKLFKDKKVCVNISLDGLEITHDSIRGKGVFCKAIDTIKELKNLDILYGLGIKMTVQQKNIKEIISVYNLSKELNVSFSLMPVVKTDAYFKNDNSLDSIQIVYGEKSGEEFYSELVKLKRLFHVPYIDMLIDIFNGKNRNMKKYCCLFPEKNNMIYTDGTLGICFMTGRMDINNYLDDFIKFEKDNSDYRKKASENLLLKECINCCASCAGNYKINLLEKLKIKIFNCINTKK